MKAAQQDSQNRIVKRIPFEDYVKTWTSIGTTKADTWRKKEPPKDLDKRPDTLDTYFGLPGRKSSMGTQHKTFRAIMYGNVRRPKMTVQSSSVRQERIDQMRKIYLHSKTPDRLTPQDSMQRDSMATRGLCRANSKQQCNPGENESDQLVAWTQPLSSSGLE